MVNFSESGHPKFRSSSAFGRRELRSKGGGKKAFHFNGSDENIELLRRTVILRIGSVSTEPWEIYATNYPKTSGLW